MRAEISQKYGVPLKNVSVKFEPILIDKNGKSISLASEVIDNDLVVKVMQKATKYVPWVLEPRHKGHLVGRKDIY